MSFQLTTMLCAVGTSSSVLSSLCSYLPGEEEEEERTDVGGTDGCCTCTVRMHISSVHC